MFKKFDTLMKQKAHYRVHKRTVLYYTIVNQLNPVDILTFHFCKINFNIILSCMLWFPSDLFMFSS
jgi:hypothetical protein